MTFYEVETSLDLDGSDIRLGMLANVRVLVGEQRDVLTIPAAAVIYRQPNETSVKLRGDDDETREVAIEIGLNDGILVEVLSGLTEGQTVLVPLVPPTEQFQSGF